jgi:hypothetical protein
MNSAPIRSGQRIQAASRWFAVIDIAAAFFIASAALKRGWRGRWPLQIVGPALALYLLFGLSWALAVIILGAVLGGLALRWAEHHDS